MIPIVVDAIGEVGIMFRWLRRRTRSTEAAPAARDPRPRDTAPSPAVPGTSPADAPAVSNAPAVSLATGELAAIAARLHGGPVRPPHLPAHKAETADAGADPAGDAPRDAAPVAADPDLRPLTLIVHAALAHHFGPDGAWALVRRTPETTAGFFDELMTAHIARDVALALGAAPAAAELPLEDARAAGSVARADAARERTVARELAVFDEDPLDDALAELAGDPRRVPATLRAVRRA